MNVTDLIKLINSDEYTVCQELDGSGEVYKDRQGFRFTGEYSEGTTHEQGGMDGHVSEYISLDDGTRSISALYDFDDNEIILSESQFKTVTNKLISKLWD